MSYHPCRDCGDPVITDEVHQASTASRDEYWYHVICYFERYEMTAADTCCLLCDVSLDEAAEKAAIPFDIGYAHPECLWKWARDHGLDPNRYGP